MLVFCALLCLLTGGAQARCPNVTSLPAFDLAQYVGQWYEISRYPQLGESFQTCVQILYRLQPDGSVRLENRGIFPDGRLNSITGSATVPDPSHPAELHVVFDEGFSGGYSVLATDYTRGALVHDCTEAGEVTIEHAWILSRTPTIEEELVEEYEKVLVDAGSDVTQFSDTPQDCGNIFLNA